MTANNYIRISGGVAIIKIYPKTIQTINLKKVPILFNQTFSGGQISS